MNRFMLNRLFNKPVLNQFRSMATRPKYKPPKKYTLTILGTIVPSGRALALLLKQISGLKEIRLYGTSDYVCDTAIDLSSIDTNTKIKAYKGDSRLLRESIIGSDIIVICGGEPSKLTENQRTLFYKNFDAVRHFALHIIEYNPKAIVLISTPPVNSFVPMIVEEYKKAGVCDPRRIIGLSNVASICANSEIADILESDPTIILCPTIGGLSKKTTVVVSSEAIPIAILDNVDAIQVQKNVANYEHDVLEANYMENSGSCYLLPAFSTTRFVTSLISAMNGDNNCLECAYVRQLGHIEDFLPYLASLVRLGPEGVHSAYMPRLGENECLALKRTYPYLKDAINLGVGAVTGEVFRKNRMVPKPSSFCETVHRPVEMVGDVVVDLSKKYRNFKIFQ